MYLSLVFIRLCLLSSNVFLVLFHSVLVFIILPTSFILFFFDLFSFVVVVAVLLLGFTV